MDPSPTVAHTARGIHIKVHIGTRPLLLGASFFLGATKKPHIVSMEQLVQLFTATLNPVLATRKQAFSFTPFYLVLSGELWF